MENFELRLTVYHYGRCTDRFHLFFEVRVAKIVPTMRLSYCAHVTVSDQCRRRFELDELGLHGKHSTTVARQLHEGAEAGRLTA